MAKSKKQFVARELRRKGLSLGEIKRKLKVSKSSVSLWCSDIRLTQEQIDRLHEQMVRGGYKGRMKGSQIQKERKKEKIKEYLSKARKDISMLKKRELLIVGLGLYWGEGSKNCSNVRFYNSNPLIVKFIMKWFREPLKVKNDRFSMYITINEIHKERLKEVVEYWSKLTQIPVSQFREPFLIKAKNKKVYENFKNHYGTLSIRIKKSSELLYRILGLINALSEAG